MLQLLAAERAVAAYVSAYRIYTNSSADPVELERNRVQIDDAYHAAQDALLALSKALKDFHPKPKPHIDLVLHDDRKHA